jgi:phage FluMu gp28-like protein
MDCFYIGYNKDMAQEFIEDCADWSKHFNHAAENVEEFVFKDVDKDILAFRIRYASGHKVVALSSRPANLRGKQGKIIIDEAAFHDDLAGLLKAAVALLMWGGKLVIISTHDGDDNLFNEIIEEILAGKKPYSHHKVTFWDAVEAGLYKRICLRKGIEYTAEGEKKWCDDIIDTYGDDADEELHCIPSKGSGAYFTRQLVKGCMKEDIPVITWSQADEWVYRSDIEREKECSEWLEDVIGPVLEELDPKLKHWFGEDFARNQNLTVVWPIQELSDTTLRVPFGLELFNIPFKQQEQILWFILDRLPNFCGGAMDSRGNGQSLAERTMQRYGQEKIHMVMLTDKWYSRYFPDYKATITERTIQIPKNSDVLDDHRTIKKVKGIPKIVERQGKDKKSNRKRHGDSVIAGLMAVYAVNEIEYIGPVVTDCLPAFAEANI